MKLNFASIIVSDQDRAVQFYTAKLGFVVKEDIRMGSFRWLTIASPDGPEGMELILEGREFPPSAEYQQARYQAEIPALALTTADIRKDFTRLSDAGVVFRGEPEDIGFVTAVRFEDGCGNLVNLVQPAS